MREIRIGSIAGKEMMDLAATARKEYAEISEEQQLDVRNIVLSGLEQINKGMLKDFNEVCDRLEKEYSNASIQN